MKEEVIRLLRESLPQIIGTLVAAGILGALGAVFLGYGIVGAAIVILLFTVVVLGVLWLSARIRKAEEPPIAPEFPTPPPGPVPRPPRHVVVRFIDRHDEQGRDITELVIELLGEGQCINLWGSGGVGKTTLAVEATHRVFPAPFSGGIIWDSADGRADYGLVTLLDQVLTALGREDARTLAPDAKADLVGYLLNQSMPCLLGLDNLETIAREERRKILDFLAGVPCPALLTSRMRLPQAQNIRVGPMTPKEAAQFLQSLVDQSTEQAKLKKLDLEEVAAVAERNPMLMRWVVAQLEEAMRAKDVFDKIARGKGEAPERIFNQSFDNLGDNGQMALLALALFVPTASREALAAVCGFEDGRDRVNEAIRTLAAFDLLDTAVEGNRLGIVALTRRLTEAQLRKDERTGEIVWHFVQYFRDYAEAHPDVTKEDLDALDDERENLLAALDHAYAAEDWESVMRITNAIALPGFLDIRGYWGEAIKWGERALDAARRTEVKWPIGRFSDGIAWLHMQHGDYEEARRLCLVAIGIAKELGADQDLGRSLGNLAIIAQYQGNYDEAKDLCHQSLEIKRTLGDQAGIAASVQQLGVLAQDQGDYDEAKDLCKQSLEIKRTLGEQAGIASSLGQLGNIASLQGDYQEAKRLYKQSLEIFEQLGDQARIATCLHNLAAVAQDQGDYQEAERMYNRSLKIRRILGDQAGIAASLHQLGTLAQDQGNYDEARDLYNQSLEIQKQLGNQAGIAKSLHQLGRVAEERGKVKEATQFYSEALAIFEKLGLSDVEMARRSLARVTGKKPKE